MGECGCGDGSGVARFPGVQQGEWYVLHIFPPCPDCDASFAFMVERVTETGDLYEFYGDVPVADFDDRGCWWRKLLDGIVLKETFAKEVEGDEFDEPRFSFDEFVARAGLREAYNETQRREADDATT